MTNQEALPTLTEALLTTLTESWGINITDVPVIADIDAAIEDAIYAGGVLDMSEWHGVDNHWCGTTHCRAGWAVHIAGEKQETHG